ncbi:unnamed protein product [Zymoseptoria tritici ST99CH_3D7]|uniref:F-box domain-containing protein n=2 Tax=Zymoseptoria tritici TaxID=1047171 RepID=A0A1X7RM12_ZYMT9|nr:unnamed protein product [Zymoseptoria tritici ST99CH_3D7]SMR48316.1 unnamed protein product [Zymoseptoria tritici ST99CH_1E4]
MSLLGLSNEVIDLILESCDKSSIKAIRLVDKRLHKLGNRHLIQELQLHYNRESLDILYALSTSKQDIAKGIQAIWLQIDRLEEFKTFDRWDEKRQREYDEHDFLLEDWKDYLRAHDVAVNSRIAMPAIRRDRLVPAPGTVRKRDILPQLAKDYLYLCYAKYCQLVEQQRELDRSHELRERLAAFFRVPSKLSGIWITFGGGVRKCSTFRSATFREGLVFPNSDWTGDYDEMVRAASQILLGALDARIKPDTLVFGGLNYRFLTQTKQTMTDIANVLQHVEHLQWEVGDTFVPRPWDHEGSEPEDDEDDESRHIHQAGFAEMHAIFDTGRFADFLSSAEKLRTLVISLPDIPDTRLAHVDLASLVGSNRFPVLDSFSIRNVMIAPDALTNFLLRHKETLTQLRMCDLHTFRIPNPNTTTTWQGWFREMSGKLPNLRTVTLRGTFDEPGSPMYIFGWTMGKYIGTSLSRAVETYLIHGGAEVPLPSREASRDAFSQLRVQERRDRAGQAIVPEIKPLGWSFNWEDWYC